ncbi:Gfo/Idh/MocA family protein [Kribbella sp. NPDC056345]|uniref:Gfo/Idh/MocA family protein n=1 Tax=Kribbella sp. NPDC056345 TaxID=3345789 RepID=UPI0035D598FD
MMERVVLIGTGGFGQCWEPALTTLSEYFQVVGVVEPDDGERARSAKLYQLPDPRAVAALPLLARWQPTLVIDSSPFRHRLANAEAAFAAGADFIGAKPLGISLTEAEQIIDAGQSAGRRVAVAQQMRYFPCFLALRRLLQSGDLGSIRSVRVRMALDGRGWAPGTDWRLELDQPLLREAAIHHFDLLRWCLSTEMTVVALAAWNPPWSPFTGDASVTGLLRTEAGAPIVYDATFAPAPDQTPVRFDSGWDVVCDGGRVVVHEGALSVDGQLVEPTSPQAEPVPLEILNEDLLRVWLDCKTADAVPPFSGADNLHSMTLLEQALRLASTKR